MMNYKNMHEKIPIVYIMTNQRNGTLYTGVTSNIHNRVHQHKQESIQGFTKKYKLHLLVYIEQNDDMYSVIEREKQIKKWKRSWKIELIEKENPQWKDLSTGWFDD